jgi:hypothetical protein
MARHRKRDILIAIVLVLFIISIYLSQLQIKNSGHAENKSIESIFENITLENHKSTGLKVFTNPPDNITSFTSKSWFKKGVTTIGNTTYNSLSSEIRLNAYEYKSEGMVNYDYILGLEKFGQNAYSTYFLKGKEVRSYSIQSTIGVIHLDMAQNGKTVYVIRYFDDSKEQAAGVLESAIL